MTLQIDEQTKTNDPKAALQQPPLYLVLLLNDDYTPMDFQACRAAPDALRPS